MNKYTKKKRQEWSKRLNKGKERKRLESPAPDYPAELPNLRREIIITDYDFGEQVYIITLEKTRRVDCYKVFINGELWKSKVGWSKVLEKIRKDFQRLSSKRNI